MSVKMTQEEIDALVNSQRWKEFQKARDLRGKDLSGLSLRQVDFDHCDMRDVSLVGCDIRGASFACANLQDADFRHCLAEDSNFYYADLRGVNFEGADPWNANFQHTNLRRCNFHGIKRGLVHLAFADASHADFRGVNLAYGELESTDFTGAKLDGVDMSNYRGACIITEEQLSVVTINNDEES